MFGLCLLKQFWVSGMKSSWVYFLHLLERNFLKVTLVHPYCYYFLCACFRGHLLLDPGKVSFVWWLYHIPLLSVFCTVFWAIFLWDFSEEICEFGAAFDYSWESVRRNTESLGFCTWLFPGLVFIVPRKSIFPSSILIHFLSLSMVLDHLIFFPLSIYTSHAGALEDIIHIPVKWQEKYLTWD